MDGELINYKYFNDSDDFYLISFYGVLYIPTLSQYTINRLLQSIPTR